MPAVRTTTPLNLGGPISTETRINDRIRVPEVRLVGPGGEQVGIVRVEDALRLALEADLDLVEVAPDARPPVCKIMDYGKFKYEAAQKARESRKNQTLTVIKEQKLRPKIDDHDYETKKRNVVRFLEAGSKVKVTIMFRGREQSRPELGFRLLQRLGADVADLGFVETSAKQDGRNMTMVLAPHKGAKTRVKAQESAQAPVPQVPRPASAPPVPEAPAAAPEAPAEGAAPEAPTS
ncbi:translation initiation factor IF-3 [Rhodococcus sp. NPDC055112]|uniref:Translation initiation factor IF-3 n=1 Tax=Rhodococcus oryzae TaxID=2571143 RepID=A0ABY2RF28_9NOCA|nr:MULTISPECIES: translation initiation factor IF-3 [Rhodococcus]MCZ4558519.1 translation initiation factor IF-3 [Rhodococcus maanshanensis]TJZ74986.1 translation initiation factor IF-3 [Rhodococcus oryzae]